MTHLLQCLTKGSLCLQLEPGFGCSTGRCSIPGILFKALEGVLKLNFLDGSNGSYLSTLPNFISGLVKVGEDRIL